MGAVARPCRATTGLAEPGAAEDRHACRRRGGPIVTHRDVRDDAARCAIDAAGVGGADSGCGRRARALYRRSHARCARYRVSVGARERDGGRRMRAGEPLILWDWTFNHVGDIGGYALEHIWLTTIAVGVGFVLAAVMSLIIRQAPTLFGPVTWVAGVLYTIPSLALFAMLVPITGLSVLTAEIGLVSYTLSILVRNMVAGLRSVPPDVREAATGMGYSPWQMLWHIELPLALVVIIAGVRVAVVTTIGLVTVTALIGQGGLGFLIRQGIDLFFSTPLVIGAVLSIVLAVLADAVLVLVQRWATPWTRAAT